MTFFLVLFSQKYLENGIMNYSYMEEKKENENEKYVINEKQ